MIGIMYVIVLSIVCHSLGPFSGLYFGPDINTGPGVERLDLVSQTPINGWVLLGL